MGSTARESSQERFEQELAKALELSNLSYECEEKARWEECSPLALAPMHQPSPSERQQPSLSVVSTSGGSTAPVTEEEDDDEELQQALSKWRAEVGDDDELLMALRESYKEQAREQQRLLDEIRGDPSSSAPSAETTLALALPALPPLDSSASEARATVQRGGQEEEQQSWLAATESSARAHGAFFQDSSSAVPMANQHPATQQPDPEPGQPEAAAAAGEAAPAAAEEEDDELKRAIKASLEAAAEEEDELTAAINASLKEQEEEQERVWKQIKREASAASSSSMVIPPLPQPSAPAWADLVDDDCEEDVALAHVQREEPAEADHAAELPLSVADACAVDVAESDHAAAGEEPCSLRWARLIQSARMVQDVSVDTERDDNHASEIQQEDALPLVAASSSTPASSQPAADPALITTDIHDDTEELAHSLPKAAVIDTTSKVLRVLAGDDDDAWRMKVTWPSDANSSEIVVAIRKAIHDCSGVDDAAEEFYFSNRAGELVLLNEESVYDFLASAPGGQGGCGVLKLMASIVAETLRLLQQQQQHPEQEAAREVEEVKEEKEEDAPVPEDSEEEWQVVDLTEEA